MMRNNDLSRQAPRHAFGVPASLVVAQLECGCERPNRGGVRTLEPGERVLDRAPLRLLALVPVAPLLRVLSRLCECKLEIHRRVLLEI